MKLTEKQEANLRGYFAQILAKDEPDEFAIDKLIQAVKDIDDEEKVQTP